MYHETFWVAIAAAAPVIALAAIVAYNDLNTHATRIREWQLDHPWWTFPKENIETARKVAESGEARGFAFALIIVFDTILQAAILGFSLSSLASRVNEMPTAVAVIAEVAGIGALACSAVLAAAYRKRGHQVMALTVQMPDDFRYGN